ncbi:MAG: hypothetical protein K8I02_09985 [Candidatus Methylomirabilis sp.]|nr:hypothetical protein [Deltaproteobacteria bacterium]
MNARTWNFEAALQRKRTLRDRFPGLFRPAADPGRGACMVSPRLMEKYPIDRPAAEGARAFLEALEREARALAGVTIRGEARGLRFRLHLKHT